MHVTSALAVGSDAFGPRLLQVFTERSEQARDRDRDVVVVCMAKG